MPYSIPILSIPAYYILALYPRFHATIIVNGSDPKLQDNRNPRSSQQLEKIRKNLSPRQFAAYERAQRCHANSMENMPLFVAAVLAGVMADQRQKAGFSNSLGTGTTSLMLSEFAIGWLVVRTLYTVAYLRTETKRWSYLRTLLYNIGAVMCFAELVRSAKALV